MADESDKSKQTFSSQHIRSPFAVQAAEIAVPMSRQSEPAAESGSDQPPASVPAPVQHDHPLNRAQIIGLVASTLGAVASGIAAQPVEPFSAPEPPIVRVLPTPRDDLQPSSSNEGNIDADLKKVAQQVFEHFVDETLEEAYEAIAQRYADVLRRKLHFTEDERRQFERLPPPADGHDGRSVFRSAWRLLADALCTEDGRGSISSDSSDAFITGATKALEGAGLLSKTWAELFGVCLSITWKTGLDVCCGQ